MPTLKSMRMPVMAMPTSKKAFATYRLHWNDKAKTLDISARKGSYRNMVKERQLNIELLDGSKNTVTYKGKALKVVMGKTK